MLIAGLCLNFSAVYAATVTGFVKWEWKPLPGTMLLESADARGLGVEIGERRHKKRHIISARLQLIDAKMKAKTLSEDEIRAWYRDGLPLADKKVYFARTDAKQHYVFEDVAPGEYYLAAFAPCDDVLWQHSDTAYELQRFLPDYDQFALFVMRADTMEVLKIKIEGDDRIRADFDFPHENFTVRKN